MTWVIKYTEEASKDLEELDNSQKIQVFKAIKKVSGNPLPNIEGGYGKPLGNHSVTRLAGYLKITLKRLGLRVVYGLVRENKTMNIIIISVRSDETVYKMAQQRIK